MTRTTKWLAGINALLGLYLIAAPFAFDVPEAALWNDVIVGAVITLVGGYNYYLATKNEEVSVTGAGLNALLGLWMIAAPFVLGVIGPAVWSDVTVGVLVALFAGYNAYVGNKTRQVAGGPRPV